MYIKKILWALALIGLIILGIIANYIYGVMLKPNTAFNNEAAYIFVPTNPSYETVREQLEPLLIDINKFDALAKQKKYHNHYPSLVVSSSSNIGLTSMFCNKDNNFCFNKSVNLFELLFHLFLFVFFLEKKALKKPFQYLLKLGSKQKYNP